MHQTASGRAAGVCLTAVVSKTDVCCLVSCLGVRLYHRYSGDMMEPLCCKDWAHLGRAGCGAWCDWKVWPWMGQQVTLLSVWLAHFVLASCPTPSVCQKNNAWFSQSDSPYVSRIFSIIKNTQLKLQQWLWLQGREGLWHVLKSQLCIETSFTEISILCFAGGLESSLKNMVQIPPVLWLVHGGHM